MASTFARDHNCCERQDGGQKKHTTKYELETIPGVKSKVKIKYSVKARVHDSEARSAGCPAEQQGRCLKKKKKKKTYEFSTLGKVCVQNVSVSEEPFLN